MAYNHEEYTITPVWSCQHIGDDGPQPCWLISHPEVDYIYLVHSDLTNGRQLWREGTKFEREHLHTDRRTAVEHAAEYLKQRNRGWSERRDKDLAYQEGQHNKNVQLEEKLREELRATAS